MFNVGVDAKGGVAGWVGLGGKCDARKEHPEAASLAFGAIHPFIFQLIPEWGSK